MEPFEREEQAPYHETGHAIAALDVGRLLVSVNIIPDGNSLGHCYGGKLKPNDDGLDLLRFAIEICAGPIAHGWFAPSFPWREEMMFELNELNMHFENRSEEFQRIVEELVHRRWPAIERIAWLLLEHRTLSGDEVRAAVEPDPLTFEIQHAE